VGSSVLGGGSDDDAGRRNTLAANICFGSRSQLGEPVSGTFKRVCSCRDIGDPDGRVVLQHRDRGLAIRSERNYGPGDAGCRMACAVVVWPVAGFSPPICQRKGKPCPRHGLFSSLGVL